jgi:PAS domain S-box-containing protein
MLLDRQGRCLSSNKTGLVLMNLDECRVIGMQFRDMWPEDIRPAVDDAVRKVMNGESCSFDAYRHFGKDIIWMSTVLTPVPGNDGMPDRFVAIGTDITTRKRTEDALRQSEERLQTLVHAIPDSVFFKDAEGRHMLVNRAVEELIGIAPGEMTGKTVDDIFPPEVAEKCRTGDEEIMRGKKIARAEESLRGRDGEMLTMDTIKVPLYDEKGESVGLVGVARDITERKRAEEALIRSESRNRALVDAIPDLIFHLNSQGVFLDYKASKDVPTYVPPKEFVGKSIYEVLPDNIAKQTMFHLDNALRKGGVQIYEYQLDLQGDTHNFEARIMAAEKDRVVVIVRDITERIDALEALRESEEKYRALLDNALVGIFRSRIKEGIPIEANDAVVRMFGYGSKKEFMEEFVGTDRYENPDDRKRMLSKLAENGSVSNFQCRMLRKDGTPFWAELSITAFPEEEYIEGAVLDITKRMHALEALRESEKELREVVQNMPVMMNAYDDDGNIVVWNRECERVSGYSAAEIVNNPGAMQLLYPDADYRRRMLSKWKRRGNDYRGWEWRMTSKDGIDKTVAWSNISNRFPIPGWASWGVGIDLTEHKRLFEENLKAQKLDSLGMFAGSISHDFNNILAIVLNNMELAQLHTNEGTSSYIERTIEAVTRGREMVENLLTFSRGSSVEAVPVDISKITKETAELMTKESDPAINVDVKVMPGVWDVFGNPAELRQVVMNLYTNATDAIKSAAGMYSEKRQKGHFILIRVDNVEIPGEFIRDDDVKKGGEFVRLTVIDNGCGMDSSTVEHLFEPFYSTKKGGMCGIGLSAAYGIARKCGGWIDVESTRDSGSVFRIYLPRHRGDRPVERQLPSHELKGGTETVLVVDDEQHLANCVREMLEHLGYKVLVSYSAQDALVIYRKKHSSIDLVIADMTMHGMSGIELSTKIRQIKPGARLIITSGRLGRDHGRIAHDDGSINFLPKPFDYGTLSNAVRESLGGHEDSRDMKQHINRIKLFCVREKTVPYNEIVSGTEKVYELFRHLSDESREKFIVVFLDANRKIIAYDELAQGTSNEVVVYPQEVVKTALLTNATSIILVHNHPSGESGPSPQDIEITSNILNACRMFNIELLDHVIIGKEGFFSFKADD